MDTLYTKYIKNIKTHNEEDFIGPVFWISKSSNLKHSTYKLIKKKKQKTLKSIYNIVMKEGKIILNRRNFKS